MKAALYYGMRDIRLEDVPIPQINGREILVKCRAAAICGTDLRIYNYGHSKIPAGTKVILGHELAGDVVDVGNKVTGIKKGMRVFIAPNIRTVSPGCTGHLLNPLYTQAIGSVMAASSYERISGISKIAPCSTARSGIFTYSANPPLRCNPIAS